MRNPNNEKDGCLMIIGKILFSIIAILSFLMGALKGCGYFDLY